MTFGQHYDTAIQQLAEATGKLRASPTEWVNLIDPLLGNYVLGNPGSVLRITGRLASNYPVISRVFTDVHEKRLESNLSHAYVRSTRKPTRRIKYQEVQQLAQQLRYALHEAASKW